MQSVAFLNSLKKDAQVPPVILLVGAEVVMHRQVLDSIVKLLLSDEDVEMALEKMNGNSYALRDVLDSAATATMFSPHKIVYVSNAEGLSAPAGSAQVSELERYLESPCETTTLVFSAESIDRRRQPFKLLLAKVKVVECEPLKGQALRQWITNHLRKREFLLAPSAAGLIEELLGNNLLIIRNALEKLMLYCGKRQRIEYDDIELCLGAVRERTVWELTDAIGRRDSADATAILARLLDEGKHPLQITASLQYQFRNLLTVAALLQNKVPSRAIAQKAGIRYQVERVIRQAKAFSPRELRRSYELIFDLENRLKSAGIEERFLLEKSIIDICSSSPKRRAAGSISWRL